MKLININFVSGCFNNREIKDMILSDTILTSDGTRIWINVYLPEKDNGKVIVIAPAIGITAQFYHLFSRFFRQQGYLIISFDYRGLGKSEPQKLRGYKATLYQWAVQDVNAVLLYAKHKFQKHEIIYIGHCVGGEIIGLAPASQYINKMVLVSTALTCEKLWPWYYRVRLKVLKSINRILTWVFGYLPAFLFSKNKRLPKGVLREMANWCDSPNGLFDVYPDNNYRKLSIPVMAYSFTDDWLCPPKAVKELLNHFTNASITWYHFNPKELGSSQIGHTDFFHLSMKSILWDSLLRWLNTDEKNLKQQNLYVQQQL